MLETFTLRYVGQEADDARLDFYDASQALVGFQRSLALTTHLVLNGEVITQAPSLKGARIYALPPEEGSWKLTAAIVTAGATALYAIGTAPKDTPLGHLVSSAYDYVVSETLGFHVDYDKTLGEQFEEVRRANPEIKALGQSRFDSLVEKCQIPIRDMHRPIVASETASAADIFVGTRTEGPPLGAPLNRETFDYINFTDTSDRPQKYEGKVSSYNINTYKGRVFIPQEGRPVPFELSSEARTTSNIYTVTQSLTSNALRSLSEGANIEFYAFARRSKTGRLKGLLIVEVGDR